MKKKWIVAVYILVGVLLPVPIKYLVKLLQGVDMFAGNSLLDLLVIYSVYVIHLCIGAYIAFHNKLKTVGVKGLWRVRWPRLALGGALCVMGFFAHYPILHFLLALYPIDSFGIWAILGGYFLTDAFEKIPLKEEVQADGPQPDERADSKQSTT